MPGNTHRGRSGHRLARDRRVDVTNGQFVERVPGRRIMQSVEFESSDPAFAGEMTMTWLFESAREGSPWVGFPT